MPGSSLFGDSKANFYLIRDHFVVRVDRVKRGECSGVFDTVAPFRSEQQVIKLDMITITRAVITHSQNIYEGEHFCLESPYFLFAFALLHRALTNRAIILNTLLIKCIQMSRVGLLVS